MGRSTSIGKQRNKHMWRARSQTGADCSCSSPVRSVAPWELITSESEVRSTHLRRYCGVSMNCRIRARKAAPCPMPCLHDQCPGDWLSKWVW